MAVVAIRFFHSVPQVGVFRSTQPLKLRGLIRTIRWFRLDSNFEYNRIFAVFNWTRISNIHHYSVWTLERIFAFRTICLVSNFEYSPLFGRERIFILFGWVRISNIRHYSVCSEYSHYSVGFEFQIFATIRSVANIRTIRFVRISNIRHYSAGSEYSLA